MFQKEAIKKTAEATGNLIGYKTADTKVWQTSPQNNSETNEEEIIIERHISLKER